MTTDDALLGRLQKLVRHLCSDAEPLAGNPAMGPIVERLAVAREQLEGESSIERPAIVALLGGTGVGKSRLFSSLVGQPDASLSSDVERGFTNKPVIALAPNNKPFVESISEFAPAFVYPAELLRRSMILIDTPDIDSILEEHREITRRVIEISDVVVYVSDPEKYVNAVPLKEVLHWANRKNWLFVFNKADRAGSDFDRLRSGFDGTLVKLGFDPTRSPRFFVSAIEPDRFELPRLREELFRIQPRDAATARRLNQLGIVKYSLEPELLEKIVDLEGKLGQASERISDDVLKTLRKHLHSPQARREIARILSRRLWAELPGHIGGPVILPIWLRARLSGFATFLSMGRFLSRGMGWLSLLAVGAAWAFEAVRNRAALVRVLNLAGSSYRTSMKGHQRDAVWSLEDLGLGGVVQAATPAQQTSEDAANDRSEKIPWWATLIAGPAINSIRQLGRRLGWEEVDDDVAMQLDHDLDRIVSERIDAVARWHWRLLANLLPVVAIAHIAWRVVVAWIETNYLPIEFYGMALLLFGLSCLPGYALVEFLARSTWGAEGINVASGEGASWATLSIETVRRQIADFLRMARLVQKIATQMQETISSERTTPFAIQHGSPSLPRRE